MTINELNCKVDMYDNIIKAVIIVCVILFFLIAPVVIIYNIENRSYNSCVETLPTVERDKCSVGLLCNNECYPPFYFGISLLHGLYMTILYLIGKPFAIIFILILIVSIIFKTYYQNQIYIL